MIVITTILIYLTGVLAAMALSAYCDKEGINAPLGERYYLSWVAFLTMLVVVIAYHLRSMTN